MSSCIPVRLPVSLCCALTLVSVSLLSGVSRAVKYVNEFLATALCTQVMDVLPVQPWHSDQSLLAWPGTLTWHSWTVPSQCIPHVPPSPARGLSVFTPGHKLSLDWGWGSMRWFSWMSLRSPTNPCITCVLTSV